MPCCFVQSAALTASYSGFANGDSSANLSTQPDLTTTATTSSQVGTYPITASGASDVDYTINYVDGTLTVTQATLTVTADDQTRPQGQANPPVTYSFSGFVNGDTASVVSGAPILSTTATIASPDGQYPIAITVGSLKALNYDFTEVGGMLTVANTPATTITLTASPGSTSTYGQALTFTAIVSPTMLATRRPPAPSVRSRRESHRCPGQLVNGTPTSDSLSTWMPPATDRGHLLRRRRVRDQCSVTDADGQPGAALHHRQQPDEGLRRSTAGSDSHLLRLRQ